MRPQPTHQSQARHHPYTAGAGAGSSAGPSRKWARSPGPDGQDAREYHPQAPASHSRQPRAAPVAARGPLSPPRSERESGSPPAGLGAAFGGKEGGKWWDEELPAPPASLSSILDSFRRSGEGDRDLLLAILGAKKAEEERLTSLIQTRLTILNARLSVHAASASLDAASSAAAAAAGPLPHPPMGLGMMPTPMSTIPERTPSLASRGSASSSSSTAGPTSPVLAASYATPYDREADYYRSKRASVGADASYHLPPPTNLWRRHNSPLDDGAPRPVRVEATQRAYIPAPLRKGALEGAGRSEREREREREQRSVSPRSEATGIDMLLDAGRRVSETRQE